MSMVAGEFLEVYDLPSEHGQWNAVVTCFFLDTAPDPVAYIDLIYRLLRPGGWWINFGACTVPLPLPLPRHTHAPQARCCTTGRALARTLLPTAWTSDIASQWS